MSTLQASAPTSHLKYLTNKAVLKIYLANCNTFMNDAPLTDEEVRNTFYSLKTNKSPGYDDISFSATNNVFDFTVEPLRYIFNNSLAQGIFPEEMKIARKTPIYKGGDKENVVNYRPISALLCFLKILERIMYNRLYLYLTENNLLYTNTLAFKKDIPLIKLLFNSQIKYTKCLIRTITH